MKQAIVTTTINPITPSTRAWTQRKEYDLIIVGDLKTPHEEYKTFERENSNVKYLSPEDQEALSKRLSDSIGWKKIQRRNMGFLYAYAEGYDVIGSFDDDNIIYPSWDGSNLVAKSLLGEQSNAFIYESNRYPVLDPFAIIGLDYHHRGYPLEFCKERKDLTSISLSNIEVLVHVPIPHGDPDIDALTRIMKEPWMERYKGAPFSSRQIMPFNSQCTFVSRKALPFYFMWTEIGRVDDIWGAYFLQKVMRQAGYLEPFVVFSESIARQDRNPHDLQKDFENEVFGYTNAGKYIASVDPYAIFPSGAVETFNIYNEEMNKYKDKGIQ
jgi:hypothetical protein